MRALAASLALSAAATLGACQLISGIDDYDTGPPGGTDNQGGAGAMGGQGAGGDGGGGVGGGGGGGSLEVVGAWSQPAKNVDSNNDSSTLGMVKVGDMVFLAGEQDDKTAFKGLASVPPIAHGFVARVGANDGLADGVAWFEPDAVDARLRLTAIAAGANNDIIVAGTVQGGYTVRGVSFNSILNSAQAFWMALDATTLDPIWVKKALGTGTIDAIELGADGELLFAGTSTGRLEFGTATSCVGLMGANVGGFVARVDGATGVCVARADITKTNSSNKFTIEDSAIAGNKLTLVGSFQGMIAELALDSPAHLAGFIAQYDLDNLSTPTAVDRSGTDDVSISSITAGDAGLAISGAFRGSFANNTSTQSSTFVQVLADNFSPELTVVFGNDDADQVAGPIDGVLADGDTPLIAVTMGCQGDIQVGDATLDDQTPNSPDICFWVMLRNGEVLLADRWGSQFEQTVSDLIVGADATVLVSGATESQIQIAPNIDIEPSATREMFLLGIGLGPG